jgi:hypothetical protein
MNEDPTIDFDKVIVVLGNWRKDDLVLELHPTTKCKIRSKCECDLISRISIGHDPNNSLMQGDCSAWEHIIILLTGKAPKALLLEYGFEEVILHYPKTQEVMRVAL